MNRITKKELLPFSVTGAFSSFFMDYVDGKPELSGFYSRFPKPEFFEAQLKEKSGSFSAKHRQVLHDVLTSQYDGLNFSKSVEKNLQAIESSKTFTIVTGHQLNIFTGPLYFIYKIITTINACKRLSVQFPDYHFVPVYWMASEDHDFEEISCFQLLGKKYQWKTSQKGAVGRMHLEELLPILNDIPGDLEPFASSYKKSNTLAEAVRKYVNELFGDSGLLVVDADDRRLKQLFTPVMKEDIFKGVCKKLVESTDDKLRAAGYDPQVLAREINFFYLDQGMRERMEARDSVFQVLETSCSFSKAELEQIINETPEKLSPNVILRPLYQETILPNLAYVGGPAELVYWLQLKEVFDHFKTPFPILLPRNFAAVMDHAANRLQKNTGLASEELFIKKNDLLNLVALRYSATPLRLDEQRKTFKNLLIDIQQRITQVDPSLEKMVSAELHRIEKGLDRMEHKMLRAEKRKGSDVLRQTEKLKDFLFPGGGLQERTDNVLNFYQTDPEFIRQLSEHLDPFDYRFHLLKYE